MSEMPTIEDRFHSVAEVATMLLVDQQTVRLWINEKDSEKRLNAIKIGKSWKISRGALIDYINRRYS